MVRFKPAHVLLYILSTRHLSRLTWEKEVSEKSYVTEPENDSPIPETVTHLIARYVTERDAEEEDRRIREDPKEEEGPQKR